MSVDHYENFPVASVLLPAPLRPAVVTLYRFARGADDAADEGEATPEARHAALQCYRDGLDAIRDGCEASAAVTGTLGALAPLFARLGPVVRAHRLPLQPFYDLLSAFDQDVDVKRYADFAALRDYTRRSADPVGRLMLALFDAATPRNIADSDAICTALQLINFWQDVAVDWAKGRVYLPADAMHAHGVTEAQLAAGEVDARLRGLLGAEIARARTMMLAGAPLARRLGGRFGFELRLVVQGGLRILEKIEANDYDVFRRRPTLGRRDAPMMLWRALTMRA
ncbi:squalene synthase HpnC [Chitinasiproducens palmae]|uniref:Squalene synthase HpnC n=1 Tax=Chitinasiproducens palmae TaxID=1770053 RepID=A0A1H2PSF2_9BURK|nr:squalene synthase HpnC [Chitinasiproducens palmae]SDV49903.1 squalene synthase HpnC [Chitinasiproducens palmae]